MDVYPKRAVDPIFPEPPQPAVDPIYPDPNHVYHNYYDPNHVYQNYTTNVQPTYGVRTP